MKKTTLICLLDKPYPPDHSFVTGMLGEALPRDGDVRVQLLVMAPQSGPLASLRYHRAVCLAVVPDFSRGGRGRSWAMLVARGFTSALIDRAHRRDERAVLFVRNHPALMLVAASLRHRADGFVFQNSYPLDAHHKNAVKRIAHRGVIRLAGQTVDAVLAVSPRGLQRARALCTKKAAGMVVPLLSDLPRASTTDESIWGGGAATVRFIYVGTHQARRRLDVVLQGAVAALDAGVDAAFAFVGGKPQEIEALRAGPGVRRWGSAGRIKFVEPVPRPRLPCLLRGADVGLSLMPALPQYEEASPTKLAEYMGAGLAVLASRGVDLQEAFVAESNAGRLVPFQVESIAFGISELVTNAELLCVCKENAMGFAKERLEYSHCVPGLKAILEGKSPS